MSWRTVIISSTAKLDYQMGYLVIRKEEAIKIHLSEIEILMIESTAVSLTAALLCELTKKKIKVIFCDEKRNPSSELIGYYGAHDTSLKVRNQIAWSEEIKKHVWTEIVAEKIRKQALHLNYWNRGEAEQLYEYINEIEFGDATNCYRQVNDCLLIRCWFPYIQNCITHLQCIFRLCSGKAFRAILKQEVSVCLICQFL